MGKKYRHVCPNEICGSAQILFIKGKKRYWCRVCGFEFKKPGRKLCKR